jgi:hypothetical protein
MCGAPKERSITTLRPLGPKVTLTASAIRLRLQSFLSELNHQILRL